MDRIEQYLNQCFSAFKPTQEVTDLREELLQNARDRYNDYIAEGKQDEEASRLVIESMGDLNGLLTEMHAERSSGSADSFARASREFSEAGKTFAQQFGDLFRRQYQSGGSVCRSFSSLQRIVLDVKSADIELRPSRGSDTELEAAGITAGVEIAEDPEHVLHITEQNSGSIFSGGMTLKIRIPDAAEIAAEIHALSGDIKLNDVFLSSLQCSVTSGDLRAEDCSISSLAIHSASGDIRMTLDEPAEQIEIETASGDVRLAAASAVKNMAIHTASGDMDLKMHGGFDRYDLKAVSGDIRCRLDGVSAVDFIGSTVTGDLSCRKELTSADNHLSVRTVSGDVSVF